MTITNIYCLFWCYAKFSFTARNVAVIPTQVTEKLFQKFVWSTPCHEWDSNVSGDRY